MPTRVTGSPEPVTVARRTITPSPSGASRTRIWRPGSVVSSVASYAPPPACSEATRVAWAQPATVAKPRLPLGPAPRERDSDSTPKSRCHGSEEAVALSVPASTRPPAAGRRSRARREGNRRHRRSPQPPHEQAYTRILAQSALWIFFAAW